MKRKVAFELYQLASPLLISPDIYTEGQRERLTVLLLDVLSSPESFKLRTVRDLRRLAVKP